MKNTPQIITNNHVRELRYFFELTESEQKIVKREFDWIDSSDSVSWDEELFIKYLDVWYCLSDFMNVHNTVYCPNPPKWLKSWTGYTNDSFFSGVLIKLLDDNYCIMATYIN